MEWKVGALVAVCFLVQMCTVAASPVFYPDVSSGYPEASSEWASGIEESSENQDTIEITFDDTVFQEPQNLSNSSEMVAMDLILLEGQHVSEEVKDLLVEGDIMTNDGHSEPHWRSKRNVLVDRSKRWPNGVVPYIIDDSYDATSRGKIVGVFNMFRRVSCIRFVSRTNETDYIDILPNNGCKSYVGRQGGAQEVSLTAGCLTEQGPIIHELMHALGFGHEHNRPDRDDYVTIHWENIKSRKQHDFRKYDWSTLDHLNTSYDFASVMHFGKSAFSRNDEPTIVPLLGETIGNRVGLSYTDKLELNQYYECTCKDMDDGCEGWAQAGRCDRDDYMLTECKKSCRICGPGSGKRCKDKIDSCSWRKDRGHCDTKASMRRKCKHTCGFC